MAAKLARFSGLPGGLAAALVIAIGQWMYSSHALPLERGLYDRIMRSVTPRASREVAIIAIDDASLAQLGEWPWPRDVHAGLITKLKAQGARVDLLALGPLELPHGHVLLDGPVLQLDVRVGPAHTRVPAARGSRKCRRPAGSIAALEAAGTTVASGAALELQGGLTFAVESLTLDRGAAHLKDELMPRYAELIYNGFWFSPEREMLQAAIDCSQRHVSGTVRLKLYKGNVIVEGRKSPDSLYSMAHVTFEEDSVYDQRDAAGFIKLNALRLRLLNRQKR